MRLSFGNTFSRASREGGKYLAAAKRIVFHFISYNGFE
jgi:hypothetical protein